MRHKPYGRRYQTKINERDRKLGIQTSGTITPNDISPEASAYSSPYNNRMRQDAQQAFQTHHSAYNGNYNMLQYGYPNLGYGYGLGQPAHRMSNPPFPTFQQYSSQNHVQQPFTNFNRQNGQFY